MNENIEKNMTKEGKNCSRRGMTLLELIIVVAILAMLMLVGLTSYGGWLKRSRDAKRKEDLRAIQNALEQCYSLDVDYPVFFPIGVTSLTDVICTGATEIISNAPTDPKDNTVNYNVVSSSLDSYEICADLEDKLEGGDNWTGTEKDYCINNLQ